MKIVVPATGPDLDAALSPNFGRCAMFLIVDSDTWTHEVVVNTAAQEPSGAGIAATALVLATGAQAVIVGNLGPKATQALLSSDLSVLRGSEGSIREQVEACIAGRLQQISTSTVDEKFGLNGSRGMGGGGMGGGGMGGGGMGGGGMGGGGMGGGGMGGGGRGMGGGGRGMGGGGRGMGGGGRGMGGGGRGMGGG